VSPGRPPDSKDLTDDGYTPDVAATLLRDALNKYINLAHTRAIDAVDAPQLSLDDDLQSKSHGPQFGHCGRPLIPTEQNTTPLMLAAGAGTDLARPRSPEERATALQTVRFLVERRADVNAAGQFGWTALHAAAYQGLNDVIEFLAGQGAKLDAKDSFGQTPLSISYAIITRDIGNAYYQTPRVFRRDTADRLLKLGATPLDRSGVARVIERPAE